jgi:hypothetical protein
VYDIGAQYCGGWHGEPVSIEAVSPAAKDFDHLRRSCDDESSLAEQWRALEARWKELCDQQQKARTLGFRYQEERNRFSDALLAAVVAAHGPVKFMATRLSGRRQGTSYPVGPGRDILRGLSYDIHRAEVASSRPAEPVSTPSAPSPAHDARRELRTSMPGRNSRAAASRSACGC